MPKINVILALMCIQYEGVIAPAGLGNDQICRTPSVHARMGKFMMWANIISGLGCAISSPRIGSLSDRVGRKPLIAFTALGLLFGDIISVAAAWAPHSISVYWVLLEFAIGGLTGSFGATMAIMQSYVSDCVTGEVRASIFAQIHACMFLGQALGPPAGALFIRWIGKGDLLSVIYAATICHAFFIVFVLFGIKETVRVKRHEPSAVAHPKISIQERVKKVLGHCNLLRPLQIFRPPRDGSNAIARHNLPLLAIVDGVAFGVQLGLISLLVLYSEQRFGWRTMETSLFVSVTNITRAVVLMCALPLLVHLFSRREEAIDESADEEVLKEPKGSPWLSVWTIRATVLFDTISHIGFALSSSATPYIVSGVLAAAACPVSPVAQSLMTTYADPSRYGELLGTVSLCHALVRSVVPALMQLTWSVTVNNEPSAVFWGLAVLFGTTLFLSLWIRI